MFDIYQGDMKLGNPDSEQRDFSTIESMDTTTTKTPDMIANERDFVEDISTAWDKVSFSFGDGVDIASRNHKFETYKDYKDNEKYYKAYADNDTWYKTKEYANRERLTINKMVDSGKVVLDEDGEVQMTEGNPLILSLFNKDALKGAILARANGFNEEDEKAAYVDEAKKQSEMYKKKMQGMGTAETLIGTMAGYLFRESTAIEIAASPQAIVGKTIGRGMAKAFVTEAAIGIVGETWRESQIREHMAKSNLDYTLWDSAKNIAINAGFAGTLRGLGSGAVDYKVLKGINSKIDATDKEIFNRWLKRESYKLTKDSEVNMHLLHKVENDIDAGKQVDVSETTDIDIETKIPEETKPISLPDEVANINIKRGVVDDVKAIQDEVDEVAKTNIEDDIYEGMATPKEADELFDEVSEFDEEFKKELDSINAEIEAAKPKPEKTVKKTNAKDSEAERLRNTITSEDELSEALKNNYFGKSTEPDAKYKNMSKEDIDYLDKQNAEELAREAETLFARGGDNLAAGVISGVSEDKDGNITFDPEKFVIGLGGYTAAKALLKSPTVKKELKEWLGRKLDELEANPRSQFFTGKQNIIDGKEKKGLLERQEKADYEAMMRGENWKDQHTAPVFGTDGVASLDKLTDIYPDDIYGKNAARYYGHGDEKIDREAIRILQSLKGKPEKEVTIYRAVPKDIDADINSGDWVTITKQYAIEHGENRFDGDYKLLSKKVKAKDLATDGNSIHEQGYDPQGKDN